MSWRLRLRRHRRLLASGTSLSVLTSGAALAAVLHDGFATTDVDLHDGGIWVTNSAELLVGKVNGEIGALTSSVRTAGARFDVQQQDGLVLVHEKAAATVSVVDPAAVAMSGAVAVPGRADVHLGGAVVAVHDLDTGSVWIRPASALGTLDVAQDEPDLELGAGGRVVAGVDGTVHGLSVSQGRLQQRTASGTNEERQLAGLSDDPAQLDLTAVGALAVVLDRAAGRLHVGDRELDVDVEENEAAYLQQAGPASANVLLARPDALLRVPLTGGPAERAATTGEGGTARPVRVGRCDFGAWATAGEHVRWCDGRDAQLQPLDGLAGRTSLTFRVNRGRVVLNEQSGGDVWLSEDTLQRVSNWQDVQPPEDGEEEDGDGESLKEQVEQAVAERDDRPNTPPVAEPDEFGVRPGRTVLLPVLDNDSDEDGDLLTVTRTTALPAAVGTLRTVAKGSALQVAVAAGARGAASVTYDVTDGRRGTARATARLVVRAPSENGAPVQGAASAARLEQGRSLTAQVLGDWTDPDGDELVLAGAVATTDDTVRFRPDGTVTFVDSGTATGRKTVTLLVSDGRETAEGTLVVDVRPRGQLPPVAVSDRAVTYVGRTVVVRPLENDTDANGDVLSLSDVDAPAGVEVVPDYAAGTFTASSSTPGTSYITYVVKDGPQTALGLVRLDVLAGTPGNAAPVAVRDVALLREGGSVAVDVLSNDEDADGDVLVVQSASAPAGSGLGVSLLEHRVLRITSRTALTAPVTITYAVSDGALQDRGSVVVVPVERAAQQQPPTAVPDTARVRTGDTVDVDVLANDSHPDGDDLVLDPVLAEPVAAGGGLLFVSGGKLRYLAPRTPGTHRAVYTVRDSRGQAASAQVSLTVVDAAARNTPPVPRDLTARVFAGSVTRITVPLSGLDADGDSVTLLGEQSAPRAGRIVRRGPDWLEYEALPGSSGTDAFTYAVQDRAGERGTAGIRVGIAARTQNQPPVAVDDEVVVRPGRLAQVRVLTNDADPDGDVLSFADPAIDVPAGVTAVVEAERVVVTAGAEGTTASVPYTVTDGRGGQATAFVTVTARESAPLEPPFAVDDVVTGEQVGDRTSVDVAVLDNDGDPDGAASELRLSLDPSAGDAATVQGRLLRVEVQDDDQVIAYRIEDGDGQAAYAFVRVPGVDRVAPVLRGGLPVLEVLSGEPLALSVTDLVQVRPGRSPRLTQESRVTATNADGGQLVVGPTALRFTSAKGYSGPASVSFEVTDGTGPEDPEGLRAVLSVPITVLPLPSEPQPPVFSGAALQVAAGEAATVLDLRGSVTDPDPGDTELLRFTAPGGPPRGITASLDGSRLSVSAGPDVARGTSLTLQLTVTDGKTPPVPAPVTVTVTGSSRPLPKAVDDVVPDARQGTAVTVDVLANDSNPFPDSPLRLLEASLETGEGTVARSGDKVVVTPAGAFVGTLVVRYSIADATGDPQRQSQGRVNLTVRGRPGTPAAPTVQETGDRRVVLTWPAPTSNGAEITGYTVRAAGYTKQCTATTCTLDDVRNDTEYRFTVTATNEVGESEPSAASAPVRPDVRPDKPEPPTVAFGDQSLATTWKAPANNGSPIESYEVELSPSEGRPSVSVSTTSYTWSGLTNGQSYQVRVRAKNRAEQPSDYSEYSVAEVPAGPPPAPAAPTAQKSGGNLGGQVVATWRAPASTNGAAVLRYALQVLRNGSLVTTTTVEASVTSQTVTADNGASYTFKVSAENKAGASPFSAASAAVTPSGQPAAVGAVTAREGDQVAALTFTPPSDNGQAIRRYEVRVNGSSVATLAADNVVRGLVNGTSYRFEVRACNDFCGDYSPASAAVVPFGPPRQPGASATGGATNVTISWSPPSTNGRPLARLEISVDGGGWENVGTSAGSRSVGNGYSETHGFRVRAIDTTGAIGPENSASAVSGPAPPPPTRRYTVGDVFYGGTCANPNTAGGTWPTQASCQGSGREWLPNGRGVDVVCIAVGGQYTVTFSGGRTETWDRHARLADGRFVRTAALNEYSTNGNGASPGC